MKKKIVKCPHCGSEKTNSVSTSNFFCMDCFIEFNPRSGQMFSIKRNGSLVPYRENEFECLV